MQAFLLFFSRRLLIAFATIFLIASVTFVLMSFAPGSPFLEEQNMPIETLKALRAHYGLDDPFIVQYIRYLKSIFSGNLGPSLKYPAQTVNEIITNCFPISLTIGIEALLLSIPLGIGLGTYSALHAKGIKNYWTMAISVLGVSVPSFVIATSLQFLFAIYFPLFPVARWGTFQHTVLPSLALAIGPACFISRLLRASVLEVLNQQYVQTARTKGLKEWWVLLCHVLKNAVLPILGYLGPISTNVLVGSFVVERVFGIPGLGQWFVTGVINRDYPVIGGLTLFYSILLLANHTFIDMINSYLDPRLSFSKSTVNEV